MEDNGVKRRLEARVARIEGEFAHFNSRLAGLRADLRDLRELMDQKVDRLDVRFEKLESKIRATVDRLDSKLETAVEKLDAKIDERSRG